MSEDCHDSNNASPNKYAACQRCDNCGHPIVSVYALCDVCQTIFDSLISRPYFVRLHREWAYGQTLR